MEELGATVEEVSIPFLRHAPDIGPTILMAEATAYHAPFLKERATAYDPEVRVRLESGFAIPATAYVHAQRVRRVLEQQMEETLRTVGRHCGTNSPGSRAAVSRAPRDHRRKGAGRSALPVQPHARLQPHRPADARRSQRLLVRRASAVRPNRGQTPRGRGGASHRPRLPIRHGLGPTATSRPLATLPSRMGTAPGPSGCRACRRSYGYAVTSKTSNTGGGARRRCPTPHPRRLLWGTPPRPRRGCAPCTRFGIR